MWTKTSRNTYKFVPNEEYRTSTDVITVWSIISEDEWDNINPSRTQKIS
jgi:hypothetical protein